MHILKSSQNSLDQKISDFIDDMSGFGCNKKLILKKKEKMPLTDNWNYGK